ncbi:MAG: hypothetical protein ABSD74_13370 [Rhizomicrobium sp.]
MLNEYQEQVVVHPEISFVANGPVSGSSDNFNTFVVKSNWRSFALHEDLFSGLQTGKPLSAAAGDPSLYWLWPWDIIDFFVHAPGGLFGALAAVPLAVADIFSQADQAGLSQDAAHMVVNNDPGTWKRFFAALGTDGEFRTLRPDLAMRCRQFGGLEAVPADQKPYIAEPLQKDDPALQRILSVAVAVLIITNAVVFAGLLLFAIISIAAAASATFPEAVPFIVLLTSVLVLFLANGLRLFIVMIVALLVNEGSLIFGGVQLPETGARLPRVR